MNRAQFIKKQKNIRRKLDAKNRSNARVAGREVKASNPEFSYDKSLLIGYIKEGLNRLPVSKVIVS